MICIAIAAFSDDSPHPVFPRWAGWYAIATGVTGARAVSPCLSNMVRGRGDGILGFHIPVLFLVVDITLMTYLMTTGIKCQAVEDAATGGEAAFVTVS